MVKLAADLRLERSTPGLTVRLPLPVGLSANKENWSGVRESNPPHLLGRQRPEATGPTPAPWRALCFALRLPVSMRRIVACAGLWAGVLGCFESVDPSLSVPVCPRPCAGGKANQLSTVLTRGMNSPSASCNHDGLYEPVAAQVSSWFLIAVIIAPRFVRSPDSEVKHRVGTPCGT